MRISDWSSDVCSSDLQHLLHVARRDRLAGLPLGSKAAKRGLFGRIDALGGRLGAQCADRAIFAPKQRKWIIAVEVHRIAVRDLVDLVLRKIDRKSVVMGKSVSVRVDFGGRRIIK